MRRGAIDWREFGRWVRSLVGRKTERTRRQSRLLLLNSCKILLQMLGATAAMYAAASWNDLQHEPSVESLMLYLTISTSAVLLAIYPLHAVFGSNGSLLHNPTLRLFGLSSRASHFLFGGLALGCGPFILQADRRGLVLVLLGSLLTLEGLLPAFRIDVFKPPSDMVEFE